MTPDSREGAKMELLPCPFCGGLEVEFRENGMVWLGQSYSKPVSVEIVHHCKNVIGQPKRPLIRIGKDHVSAIAAWNTRTASPVPASVIKQVAAALEYANENLSDIDGEDDVTEQALSALQPFLGETK